MADRAIPMPPASLDEAGRSLWTSIVGDLDDGWELDQRELHLLARACRCADELDVLEAQINVDGVTVKGSRGQTVVHPALSEARQLRLVQLRLLGSIELVDPEMSVRAATPAQARGRRAAQSRWRERHAHG